MKKALGILLLIISSLFSLRAIQGIIVFILDFTQNSDPTEYDRFYLLGVLFILLIGLGIGVIFFSFGLKLVKKK